MAEVTFTPGGPCLRGKLGKLQYRRIRGKYIVSPAPDLSGVKWSPAQIAQRDAMRAASLWAKQALADLAVRAAYRERARELDVPIYALVFRDYQRGPRVESIDASGYTGQAGQEIGVRVDDPFEGHVVQVIIRDGAGTVFESGPANRSGSDQVEWTYQTTVTVPGSSGILVEAVATDRPGNRDSRTQRLA